MKGERSVSARTKKSHHHQGGKREQREGGRGSPETWGSSSRGFSVVSDPEISFKRL